MANIGKALYTITEVVQLSQNNDMLTSYNIHVIAYLCKLC